MGRRTFTAEQIIGKLREAEVLLSRGDTVGEASRKLGVTEQTYYLWRKDEPFVDIASVFLRYKPTVDYLRDYPLIP